MKIRTHLSYPEPDDNVGIEDSKFGWIAFTQYMEIAWFNTKEDAQLALLEMIFVNDNEEEIDALCKRNEWE